MPPQRAPIRMIGQCNNTFSCAIRAVSTVRSGRTDQDGRPWLCLSGRAMPAFTSFEPDNLPNVTSARRQPADGVTRPAGSRETRGAIHE
jgi:hypothetical protein